METLFGRVVSQQRQVCGSTIIRINMVYPHCGMNRSGMHGFVPTRWLRIAGGTRWGSTLTTVYCCHVFTMLDQHKIGLSYPLGISDSEYGTCWPHVSIPSVKKCRVFVAFWPWKATSKILASFLTFWMHSYSLGECFEIIHRKYRSDLLCSPLCCSTLWNPTNHRW